MEKEETKIEESTGVYLYGAYANGPDAYVLSLRQNPIGAPAPQEVEDTNPKPQPDEPGCPQCGNAIIGDQKFCCECGFKLQ